MILRHGWRTHWWTLESQFKDLCSGSASKDKWLTHHLTGTTMVSLLMLLKYLHITLTPHLITHSCHQCTLHQQRSRCWTKDPWQKQPVMDKGLVAETLRVPQMACVVYLSFILSSGGIRRHCHKHSSMPVKDSMIDCWCYIDIIRGLDAKDSYLKHAPKSASVVSLSLTMLPKWR